MAEAEAAPLEEELECEECEECVKGAPAWMSTFADMATLLMAFFVLILSFAEFNVPKFKQISGSLKNSFGVQKVIPVVEQPKGTTILELNFSPSPSPSVTNNMTQQTTETTQPDLQLDQKEKEEDFENPADASEIAKALADEIARGEVEVKVLGERVIVNFSPTNSEQRDEPNLQTETLRAMAKAAGAAMESGQQVAFEGIDGALKSLGATSDNEGQSDGNSGQGESNAKAELAEDKLKVALRQQIDQGLVEVERKDGKVIVTVGAGGAFGSGSADLTNQAKEIMAGISTANADIAGQITVTGHTDNVPLVFGGRYRDNWDLAAARSASVVQSLSDQGLSGSNMQAVSRGDTMPIDSNDTRDGRAKNRRIEIEIDY
ncbi:MAG: flagellar motor protein MotB [Rhodospirillaceae bacterium]|nr:flagellar motor protein MotB [Rhodospirillaceae bacterium]